MYQHLIKRLIDFTLVLCGDTDSGDSHAAVCPRCKAGFSGAGSVLAEAGWHSQENLYDAKIPNHVYQHPANMPTHLLSDPQKWITRSGAWFRRLSIDELPQILCILTGK